MARGTPVHSGYTILNGSGTGSNGDRIDVWVEYRVTAQGVENNTSTVTAYFYTALGSGQSSSTWGGSGMTSTFRVDGTLGTNLKNNAAFDFRISTPMLLGQSTRTISHNADGTKSISFAGSFTTPSDWITGGSVNSTVALPQIDRGLVRARMGGTWRTGQAYVRVSGSWRLGQVFVRTGGAWRRGV